MKYFQVGDGNDAPQFFGLRGLRRYLREHPEVATVDRYWWSRGDLVEVESIPRERVLSATARALTAGETAQWAQAHGRMRT